MARPIGGKTARLRGNAILIRHGETRSMLRKMGPKTLMADAVQS
jgi:hypothetical protein